MAGAPLSKRVSGKLTKNIPSSIGVSVVLSWTETSNSVDASLPLLSFSLMVTV
jgi:hypothetical protein